MTPRFARFLGFLLVASALLACASTRSGELRYAEYSLDPSRHPEGIDCFYECIASNRQEFRDACFARCDGVVATTTASPCAPGSPALCRSYEVEYEESCNADEDAETAVAILDLLSFGAEMALDAAKTAEEGDRSSSRSKSKQRTKASPRRSLGSKVSSGAAPASRRSARRSSS